MHARLLAIALLIVGLLTAACGSARANPTDATTGHTITNRAHQRSKLAGLLAVNRCLRSQHVAIWPAPNIYLRSKQPPPNILVWEVPHTQTSHSVIKETGIRVANAPRGYAIVAELRSANSAHDQARAWLRYDREHHYDERAGSTHKPPAAHIVGSTGTVAWTALDTQWPQTKVVAECVRSAAG
jgi:hypothetical protein